MTRLDWLTEQPETVECPTAAKRLICTECPKSAQEWYLADKLLPDMAFAKGVFNIFGGNEYTIIYQVTDEIRQTYNLQPKELTPREVCWLCLLIQHYSPSEIQRYLGKKSKLYKELSETIYKYVKFLTGVKIDDWREVYFALEHEYKINQEEQNIEESEKESLNAEILTEILSVDIDKDCEKLNEILSKLLGRKIRVEIKEDKDD